MHKEISSPSRPAPFPFPPFEISHTHTHTLNELHLLPPSSTSSPQCRRRRMGLVSHHSVMGGGEQQQHGYLSSLGFVELFFRQVFSYSSPSSLPRNQHYVEFTSSYPDRQTFAHYLLFPRIDTDRGGGRRHGMGAWKRFKRQTPTSIEGQTFFNASKVIPCSRLGINMYAALRCSSEGAFGRVDDVFLPLSCSPRSVFHLPSLPPISRRPLVSEQRGGRGRRGVSSHQSPPPQLSSLTPPLKKEEGASISPNFVKGVGEEGC